ncbi:MAG TPA: porin [Gammaproteobacteria bacterium]|nr:porin [Gammaproteobacteria bacterium]
MSVRAVMGLLPIIVLGMPASALADIVVYGKIYAELARETSNAGAAELDGTTLDDAQNTGRIGIRFNQDLGGGLEAFGLYEFAITAPDETGDFIVREGYVGIRGTFGSVAMGRFSGAYKITGGKQFDVFGFTSLQASGNGGMSGGKFGTDAFVSRVIEYRPPRFGSDEGWHFDAVVQYVAGQETLDPTTPTPSERGSTLAGLTLGRGQFDFIAATSHDKLTDRRNAKAGARFKAAGFALTVQQEAVEMGGYERIPTATPGVFTIDGEGSYTTGIFEYQTGDFHYVVQLGEYRSDAMTGTDASYFAAGLRYYFARNIWLLVGHRETDSDEDALDSTASVLGLRYDF